MAKKRKAPDPQKQQRSNVPGLHPVDSEGDGGDALMRDLKSPRAVLQKLQTCIRDSAQGSDPQRTNYIDNMKMLSGDQWPDEAKAERAGENGSGRPMLVFNKATKNILTLAGVQAQTGTEPSLFPFEPGDVVPSEIMSLLLRSVRERTNAKTNDRRVFIDKIGGNLGFWKVWIDYERRPQGDFRIDRLSPLVVYTDPNWLMQGWEACRYAIEQKWLPVDQAMEEWPEQADSIRHLTGKWQQGDTTGMTLGLTDDKMGDTLANQRMFFDRETQQVAAFEGWWKETVRTEIAIYLDTEEIEDSPQKVKALKESLKAIPKKERDAKIVFVRRPVTIVKTASFIGDIMLGDEDDPVSDSPYNIQELPYFPAAAYMFGDTPTCLTDIMKDPQREKNKRRTSLIEMVGRMPLSGYFNDASSGADPQEIIEYANGHGVVINHRGKEPTPIKAPEVPQAIVILEQMADKEIDSCVNVNAELLGQTTQTTVSGKAIEARQRGGLLTHEVLFATFREDVARYTKFLIKLVQEFMTPAEALRILGAYALREPNNEQVQALGGLDDMGILDALERSFSIDYDVVIGTKSYDPTHKMAEGQFLSELRSQGVPIPDDILIETLGENGSIAKATATKIIQRIQQAQQAQQAAAGGAANPTAAPSPATAA